jgi:hypothetical protein
MGSRERATTPNISQCHFNIVEDAGEEEFYEVEVESGGGKRLRKH